MATRKSATSPTNPKASPLKITADSAKYLGFEPDFSDIKVTEANRKVLMMHAFNWYNYNFNSKDSLAFVIDYLKYDGRIILVKELKRASDNSMPNAIGWLARMSAMDWELSEEETAQIEAAILKSISTVLTVVVDNDADAAEEAKATKVKFNIQERMREKAAIAGGNIEGMLDMYIADGCPTKHRYKPIECLQIENILPAHVGNEIVHWTAKLNEFKEAHSGKDKELTAAYGQFNKNHLRNLIKFIELIIAGHHDYVAFKKANKKVRKRKVKTPMELAHKLKYLKEFKELKLTSEKAAKIVGAKEMFAYDTKKRKLMYFVADSFHGELTIKNNTIVGFDTNKSVQKTIRAPDKQIKEFMKASKPNSRSIFAKTKSVETKFSGRFNENVVILKVY